MILLGKVRTRIKIKALNQYESWLLSPGNDKGKMQRNCQETWNYAILNGMWMRFNRRQTCTLGGDNEIETFGPAVQLSLCRFRKNTFCLPTSQLWSSSKWRKQDSTQDRYLWGSKNNKQKTDLEHKITPSKLLALITFYGLRIFLGGQRMRPDQSEITDGRPMLFPFTALQTARTGPFTYSH